MSGLMLGLAVGLLNSLGGLLRYIRNWPIVAGMRLATRSYGHITTAALVCVVSDGLLPHSSPHGSPLTLDSTTDGI